MQDILYFKQGTWVVGYYFTRYWISIVRLDAQLGRLNIRELRSLWDVVDSHAYRTMVSLPQQVIDN